jgi:hypothetical protein
MGSVCYAERPGKLPGARFLEKLCERKLHPFNEGERLGADATNALASPVPHEVEP